MDSVDAAIGFSLLCNAVFAMALAVYFRRCVVVGGLKESSAKSWFSWFGVAVSLLSGVVVFFGVVVMFGVNVGHGESLVIGPVLNALLCIPLVIVGRTIIGWMSVKW